MKRILRTLSLTPFLFLASCGSNDNCCNHAHGHSHVHAETTTISPEAVRTIDTQEDFTTLLQSSTKPVIVDFNAPWCGACQTLKPVFDKLASELSDEYTFVSINIDKVDTIATSLGISGIPAILFFTNGKEVEGTRHAGAATSAELKALITQAFAK